MCDALIRHVVMRWVAPIIAAMVLASCGGGDKPDSRRVARLEVSPSSVVLTSDEPTRDLRVRALAEDGTEIVGVPIAYASSKPEVVTIDGQGRVSAAAGLGSALIEISSGDVIAAPVPVVAAKPKAGVLMLGDDKIIGTPALVEPAESVIGSRFSITVRTDPPPALGSLLLSSESAAVAGQVVEVKRVEPGISTVVFEVLRLDKLFDELQIETVLTPDQVRRILKVPAGRPNRTRLADRGATSEQPLFQLGELVCKGDADVALFDVRFKVDIEHQISIRFSLNIADGNSEPFVFASQYSYDGTAEVGVKLGKGKGKIACQVPLIRVPVPVVGFLQVLMQPMVPINGSLESSVDLSTNAEMVGKCFLRGKLSAGFGFDAQWNKLDLNSGEVEHPDCDFSNNSNPDNINFRFGWDTFVGLQAGFEVDSLLARLAKKEPIEFLSARTGILFEDDSSNPAGAAIDTLFSPGYKLSLETKISMAENFEEKLKNIFSEQWGPGLVDLDFSFSRSFVLGVSPVAAAVTVDTSIFNVGQVVRFGVNLDRFTSYFPLIGPGLYNIDEIRIYRVDHVSGTAALVSKQTASDGQLEFVLEWVADFDGAALARGEPTFHAFAVPRLLRALHSDTPVELGSALSPRSAVNPARAITVPGATVQFAWIVDGASRSQDIQWNTNGGSISDEGLFLAGSLVGDYEVIALDLVRGVTGTALVTIEDPPSGFFITGTVLADDGRPVPEARIHLVVDGTLIGAQSEADGLYRLELTREQYDRLPSSFIVGASNVPLHHPVAAEIKRTDGNFIRQDFVLAGVAQNPDILSIELVPEVHHLGNSNFSGTVNSQFQYPDAEGASFSKQFYVSAVQRSFGAARLRLIAKGVQCPNIVQINGLEVARLANSPIDGSYASYEFAVDPKMLNEGSGNTFAVTATSCSWDMDDFEFAHAQIFFD